MDVLRIYVGKETDILTPRSCVPLNGKIFRLSTPWLNDIIQAAGFDHNASLSAVDCK